MEVGYFSKPVGESAEEAPYNYNVHLEPPRGKRLRQIVQKPLHTSIVKPRNEVGHADGGRSCVRHPFVTRPGTGRTATAIPARWWLLACHPPAPKSFIVSPRSRPTSQERDSLSNNVRGEHLVGPDKE